MSDDVQGVSGRKLAEILGVSEGAVRKAADPKTGRISKARLPNGKFDPVLARQLWDAHTDPLQQRKPLAAKPEPKKAAPAPAPEPDKVVPFPGPKGKEDAAARLAQHQAANLAKANKGRKASADEAGEESDVDMPALVADFYIERTRKLRNENELVERQQYDGELVDLMMEGFAFESREAAFQYVEKFYPEVAADLGLGDREAEVYAVLARTMKAHIVQTIEKMDYTKWLKRVARLQE